MLECRSSSPASRRPARGRSGRTPPPRAGRGGRAPARRGRRFAAAAEGLPPRRGVDNVTMEDIAQAAGVGKGTLYRRYPDRASIAVALLNTHERALQERLLRGPP